LVVSPNAGQKSDLAHELATIVWHHSRVYKTVDGGFRARVAGRCVLQSATFLKWLHSHVDPAHPWNVFFAGDPCEGFPPFFRRFCAPPPVPSTFRIRRDGTALVGENEMHAATLASLPAPLVI
jgi:hypothetical protein